MAFRNVYKSSRLELFRVAIRALSTADVGSQRPNFGPPGNLSDLNSEALRVKWNELIASEYAGLQDYHSRFFALNPAAIPDGQDFDSVRWAADPAEPNFCFDAVTAAKLSDWRLDDGHPWHVALSVRGRRETHNEYCEYRIVFRPDPATGKLRAKRVLFTTELREYWMLLAVDAPDRLQHAAKEVSGRDVAWSELYGPGVTDPSLLSAEDRLLLFATWVSGGAGRSELVSKGVPLQPIGTLNSEFALFMSHQINGLDDLLYIVLYGAHPYAKRKGGQWIKATKDEIFSKSHFGEDEPPIQLACRHADPAAATGAAAQAFDGRTLAFADPLGMYILGFAMEDFLFQGEAIPAQWVQFSRGSGPKLYQRLSFGPPDDSPHFLSDITVGDDETPVTGGFQVASRIEVGPWVRIGPATAVSDTEYEAFEVEGLQSPYNCARAGVCSRLARLRDEYGERSFKETIP